MYRRLPSVVKARRRFHGHHSVNIRAQRKEWQSTFSICQYEGAANDQMQSNPRNHNIVPFDGSKSYAWSKAPRYRSDGSKNVLLESSGMLLSGRLWSSRETFRDAYLAISIAGRRIIGLLPAALRGELVY